jgi:hypothetical protein
MTTERQHSIDPKLLEAAEYSPTLATMIKRGLPLTREKWISMAYLGRPPKPWTAEHEGEVPAPLRDFDKVDD